MRAASSLRARQSESGERSIKRTRLVRWCVLKELVLREFGRTFVCEPVHCQNLLEFVLHRFRTRILSTSPTTTQAVRPLSTQQHVSSRRMAYFVIERAERFVVFFEQFNHMLVFEQSSQRLVLALEAKAHQTIPLLQRVHMRSIHTLCSEAGRGEEEGKGRVNVRGS